jgi:MFS family permease
MSDKSDNPFKFREELKRRKVVRVITVYSAASFVILELVSIVAPSFGLPSWTLNMVIVLLCIGFIISTILSWVYDISPEGVQNTKPESQVRINEEQLASRGWEISTYISGLIIIGLFAVFNTETNEEK